jgi:hypothetical protein
MAGPFPPPDTHQQMDFLFHKTNRLTLPLPNRSSGQRRFCETNCVTWTLMGIARRGKKGLFQQFRRAPTRYAPVESRALVRTALHTTDENLARNKAAQIENLQDLQWEALLAGRAADATAEYEKLRGWATIC